jgi:hypothetical protein
VTTSPNTRESMARYAKAIASSTERMDGLLKEMREKRGSPREASAATTLSLEIELATEYASTLRRLSEEEQDRAAYIKGEIAAYLKTNGACCLHCGSGNVEGIGSWEDDENYVTHEVVCTECRTAWHDGYTLTFVAGVEHGDG